MSNKRTARRAYGLQIIRREGTTIEPGDPPTGAWLVMYDPDAHDGRGIAEWSVDPRRAMRFIDAAAAMGCWRMQSKRRPLRDDGRPNRPLTAYTVMAEPLP